MICILYIFRSPGESCLVNADLIRSVSNPFTTSIYDCTSPDCTSYTTRKTIIVQDFADISPSFGAGKTHLCKVTRFPFTTKREKKTPHQIHN